MQRKNMRDTKSVFKYEPGKGWVIARRSVISKEKEERVKKIVKHRRKAFEILSKY